MLENFNNMLKNAYDKKYAIPQFNINNLEWTKYILEECEKLNIPVILGVSEGASKYMGGFVSAHDMVVGLIRSLDIKIPVCLHLDHGQSFDSCKSAIDAGFSSVMIDASKYELEENIKITKEVVKYAHERGVSVEAEVGHVGGQEDEINSGILYTTVDESNKFYEETKIDALAPALGSVHGPYKGEPNLQYDRMKEISEKLNIPLVLHGGSGLTSEMFKKAIECGTCKININTELQQVWTKGVREKLENDKEVYDPRKVIGSGEENIKNKIDELVEIFETRKASE